MIMGYFNTEGFNEWWNEAKKLYEGDSGLCALRAWQHQQKRIEELELNAGYWENATAAALRQNDELKARIEELETVAALYVNSRCHLSATNKVVDHE
jgi:hypothetical protein